MQAVRSTRIDVLKVLLVVAVGVIVAVSVAVAVGVLSQQAEAADKPNILFILTDDQAQSTLSHMPNVQSLMKQKGHTFTNAFNAYPLCCPSRATIQRGQYAHNTGIFQNTAVEGAGGYATFDQRDLEQSTVATWLDAAGYRTVHMGKYMNEYIPKIDPPPPGWDVFHEPTVPYQHAETTAANVANKTMVQLREEVPQAAPFFFQVGFDAPHVPNDYESQYEGMFAGEQVPRVPSFDEQDVADKPRYIREDKPPLAQQTNLAVHEICQDDELNSIQQNDCEYVRQLRNLQTVDRFVKDAIDYLASQGELSNTYIVYYTDNGNHWGEHRLDFGKITPYQTDTGFPLLIRGPNIPAAVTSTKLVGNQDIAPTFTQIAGATTPSFVDGRSILRVADSDPTNNTPWRTALYAERRWETEWPVPSKVSDEYVPPWEAVREENVVYLRYGDDPWTEEEDSGFVEFYDLSADPHQLRNLAYYDEVPQTTLDRMQSRLLSLRGCSGSDCRTAEDERCAITGTAANDTLTGTSGADVICALGGNDTLYGGGDVITGMGGDDALRGDSGADKLKGDLGNDSLNSRDGVKGNDSLDGVPGTDTKVTDATEKSIVGFP